MDPPAWAALLEASTLGAWMRGSPWAYPVVNLAHLLGLVLLVGAMLLLDLRLLGLGRRFALADVSAVLTPLAAGGLLLQLASGALLFSADAAPLSGNALMQYKAAGIALGVANALLFRALWGARLAGWDSRPPPWGRLQAALSLLLWLAVATLGRLIAYA
ncbi:MULTISPECIES: hypothetical protein [Bordetella]|uniref:N-acetyltransferase YedL n=2 Tax=Bordetella bronchiseptica TaxID=518 RepID=A0ABR4RLZ6_BORBO|nr:MULTISPECIES: hypothetical protein [Bordetella]SHS92039.1 Uncharacterised protein [Mycobacteroides abscessus subsp. abscessus]AOB25431.1 hypothetical protein BBB44_03710 [Bordetella bronchiseptica]KCV38939.1 hypothetical protein L490_0577 [Bordetella bronchiseptica 00-P-2796]KCV60714.1 hypothetical protein L493_0732 [Bordetella bronchiseptica 99-R-0433]KDB98905.1 hypothetical protein AZ18_0825 [Bordetella bronchiseptica D993]